MSEQFLRIGGTDGEKARALKTTEKGDIFTKPTEATDELIVTSVDYSNKKRGNDIVPHVAKLGYFELVFSDDRLSEPKPSDAAWEEISNTRYNLLNDRTGQFSIVTRQNNHHACMLFSVNLFEGLKSTGKIPKLWTITDLRTSLLNFKAKWTGRGASVSGDGASMYFYLRNSDIYSREVISSTGAQEETLGFDSSLLGSGSGIDGQFIDDEGFVHFLITTNGESLGGDTESRLYTRSFEVTDIILKRESIIVAESNAYDNDTRSIRVNVINEQKKVNDDVVAYDEMQDRLKVSVEESTTRKLLEEYIRFERQGAVVETLFDGELESDEYVNDLYSLYRGEKETRILVSTDQEGFRMIVGAGPFDDVENFYNGTTYPNTFDVSESFTEDRPLHVLPIYRGAIEVDENTTWEQAYQHRQLNDFRLSFRNTASEKANVTIKIMRIFK